MLSPLFPLPEGPSGTEVGTDPRGTHSTREKHDMRDLCLGGTAHPLLTNADCVPMSLALGEANNRHTVEYSAMIVREATKETWGVGEAANHVSVGSSPVWGGGSGVGRIPGRLLWRSGS